MFLLKLLVNSKNHLNTRSGLWPQAAFWVLCLICNMQIVVISEMYPQQVQRAVGISKGSFRIHIFYPLNRVKLNVENNTTFQSQKYFIGHKNISTLMFKKYFIIVQPQKIQHFSLKCFISLVTKTFN